MVGYFFHWQTSHRLAEAALLRAGAEPQAAWYDNSKANPHDAEAQADMRRGEQTYHEMMVGFFGRRATGGGTQATLCDPG